MTSYRLTRHLYALDEVALTLLTALLARRDLDECYYWTAELSSSGWDLFPWLWWVYYSFYAELNPRLEAYMRTRSTPGTFREACAVIRNMHRATPTPTVFLLSQSAGKVSDGKRTHTRTTPIHFPNYPQEHQPWLMALKQRDMQTAATHLMRLAEAWCPGSLFQMMCEFHVEYMGAAVDTARMQQYWDERPGADDLHHLVAIMVHLLRAPGEYCARRLFIAPREDGFAYLSPGAPFGRPDRLLAAARKYPTGQGLAPFGLAREGLGKAPIEALRHHWEYYCGGCPLWRQRLHDCGATLDHKARCIEFRTDEGLEAFYGLYGLEPDEQPLALQMLSVGDLSGGSPRAWLTAIFGDTQDVSNVSDEWKWNVQIDNYFR